MVYQKELLTAEMKAEKKAELMVWTEAALTVAMRVENLEFDWVY